MADQPYPKDYGTSTYPVLAEKTGNLLQRVEPLLTPEKLISRYLKGIEEVDQWTPDELKDRINLAINEVELMIDTTLTQVKRKEKHPFDIELYRSFIHIMSNFGPIVRIDKVSIQSSNDKNIFEIPASWIESARFFQKQINIIPLTVVGATGVTQGQPTGAAGLAFIAAMNGGIEWVPSYWEIEYTTGVCNKEGHVPLFINELVGVTAAIEILSNLGPQNANTNVSVSHDGISQSSSNPGPALYQTRIGELQAKREMLINRAKKTFYNKYFLTNI